MMTRLTPQQCAQLIDQLQQKKQKLIDLMTHLIRFEQRYGTPLWVVGSVARCRYWLDSDVDVYLDLALFKQAHPEDEYAWVALDELASIDMIVYPPHAFKKRIEAQGIRPDELRRKLAMFDDEASLIKVFAQRRIKKIERTLDNSHFMVAKVVKLQGMYVKATQSAFDDDAFLANMLVYDQRVQQLAFRFVWVGLMILSRYEHFFDPKGAEVKGMISETDWQHWCDQLAQPTTDRAPFVMPGRERVADLYRYLDSTNAYKIQPTPKAIEPMKRLGEWIDSFAEFECYTRAWLTTNWVEAVNC
ncbi:hypothetical protein [Thiomicrospira microaerophila]|uniref:hypothetical protein n=1 Tax=Thiomicrospira microaerophila TaxID=406020 RepID=UPI0012FDBC37|nr:hypothetical protein [Thiomicrospira microaerophila]